MSSAPPRPAERPHPMLRGTQQRGDERRSAMLASLEELLRESSLEAITIAEISRRAGVTRSAFYFYFENKAYAVAALMGEVYDEAFAGTELLLSDRGTPAWRITTMIDGLFSAVASHLHLYKAMLEAKNTDATVRALWEHDRASFVEPVAGMIRTERAAGRAPDGPDPVALASALLDLNDRGLERLASGEPVSREDHLAALTAIWLRSIYGEVPADLATPSGGLE